MCHRPAPAPMEPRESAPAVASMGSTDSAPLCLSSPCSSDRRAGSPVRLSIHQFYQQLYKIPVTMHTRFFSVCLGSPLAPRSPLHMQRSMELVHTPLSITAFLSTGRSQTTQVKRGRSQTTDFNRLFPVTTTSINNQGFFLSFVVCIMWHLNSLYTNSSSALIVCFCTVIN